ncbi:MAG: O-methyltransferase [Crenarchaeota archaeon]|nr:MAG: O-methyltransferase [Thermoproteota archaeon]RDJ34072.1 MAG: O-methyltransferase [Thermoproteota archaeon]RDJ36812.1 MAG: O-methyltransferase [Thermoproteota archaeon]RDJ37654.1 MAG: O-methyltransferase [Thermoproteota archaeon]
MDSLIKNVISRLTQEAQKERMREVDVPPEDRMLAITQDTGEFFNIILKAIKAKNILEIGLSTGYSTLWFCDAIKENSGKIITIEKNQNKILRAKKNFQEAGVEDFIDIRHGIALNILNGFLSENKQFDFVFLDADKENTMKYFEIALKMTRIGGIIAIDNMMYPEKYRSEMSVISQRIQQIPNVQSSTVKIGNGEEIILKLAD